MAASLLALALAVPALSAVPMPPAGSQSVELGCSASAPGSVDLSTPGTVAAGPIAWPVLRHYTSQLPPAHYLLRRRLAPGIKALVAVRSGRVVRVDIPASERARLSLDYTMLPPRAVTADSQYFQVGDGARQVTFHACAPASGNGPETPFAGYFIVAGAQCGVIDIYTSASTTPIRRQIPFGVSNRSCPAGG
jgi:hypothetical protein